jgi:hypothetical protein
MFSKNRAEWDAKRDQIVETITQHNKNINAQYKERDDRLHDLVGEFTRSYAGGTAVVSTNLKDYKITKKPGISAEDVKSAEDALKDSWQWLSRVASPKHEKTIARQEIALRAGGGGSHDGKNEIVTVGIQQRSSTRQTVVHEYGHALENADARTLRALDEDFTKRSNEFFASEKGSKIMGIEGCTYYECVYKANEQRQNLDLYAPSHLGYARRYSDCGYDAKTRGENSNNPRFNRGTEVFSTGIESIYREPSTFRRRARHGFDLAVLILAGRF